MSNVARCLEAIRGLDLASGQASSSAKISDLLAGGYLDLNGVTYRVERMFRYLDVKWSSFKKRKADYWVTELELFNVLTGEKKYLEWEVDDDLEISETIREVRLSQILVKGQPVSRRHLESIADEESGAVTVGGTEYHYSEDDTWAALFYREADADPLPVRMYEFESRKGEGLTIEMWEEEEDKPEREAFLSQSVSAHSVVVLQTGVLQAGPAATA